MDPMDDFNEFGEPGQQDAPACAVCETLLPDAVDGLLSAAEQRAFDSHVAICRVCATELAEAQRGAAWLGMLKSQAPMPPESLLAKILAETSGGSQPVTALPYIPATVVPAAAMHQPSMAAPQARPSAGRNRRSPEWSSAWAYLRSQLRDAFSIESASATFQPRIAMTAAMAFFSIALTLNLTGVRLRDLRPASFTPSALKRSIANLDASATRMFQNNRAVYQVESRLNELRGDDAASGPAPDTDR